MGKEKYLKNIMGFFEKTPVVSTRDLKMMVGSSKDGYIYLLVHNLIKSGRIKKIVKGFYTLYDDPVVSVFCFRPSYIGLQDALSFHGVWDQETNTVIITSRKVRTGLREFLGANAVVRNIKPKYMFGFELVKYDNLHVPVSDLEKTLIDFEYFGEHLDNDTLRTIKRKIDIRTVNEYLKHYPKGFGHRVLKMLEI